MSSIEKINKKIIFESLAEAVTSSIFVYQGGRFKYTNHAFSALTDYSVEELKGIKFQDLFPPGARVSLRNSGLDLRKCKCPDLVCELPIIKKNQEERWISISLTTIEYSEKPAIAGTAIDVTDRKRAEVLQDAVYRIAQAADRSRRLEDLYPAIHQIIGEVMVANNFYIAIENREDGTIEYPYYVDEADPPAGVHKPGKGLTEWILREGKSLLVDEKTQGQLEENGAVELVGSPSVIWLGVPLKIDEDVIGVMVVQDYSNPNQYGEREQRILEFVSSQVAMAINRKRSEAAIRKSEERFRRRADELTILYETTRGMAIQQDLTTLLNTIADRVVELLTTSGCTIYLFNKERRELEAVVSRGWPGIVGVRLALGEGIAGMVAETLQPIVVDDHRTWTKKSHQFNSIPARAVAVVPMIYRGELVGVLTAFELVKEDNSAARKFSSADLELLGVFAATTAGVVNNTKLFDETRQRLVESELLYQASLSASQIHSIRAVAQRIVDAIESLMGWKSSLWIVEAGKPVLLAYGSKGMSGSEHLAETDRVKQLIQTLDDGIVGWVYRNGLALRSGDVKQNPFYVLANQNIESELCVPMKLGGKTIGCINVESKTRNAFSEHDERLLMTLANQAGGAIENARLFEETRRRAGRQSALNTIIMNATRAGTDLEGLLNTTLDQTLKAFGLDMGAIWITITQHGIKPVATRGVPPTLSMMLTSVPMMGDASLNSTIIVGESDVPEIPLTQMLEQLNVRGALICPLIVDDRRIGGLAILSLELKKWLSDEITFVEAIAGELGAAAERARLFDETRSRLMEFEAINRVSSALRLAHSIDTMLPELLEETLSTLDTETGCIWLYDEKPGKLIQAVGRGWCTRLRDIGYEPGVGIPGTVYTTGDILFTHDIAEDPLTPNDVRALIPQGWSAVCIPIRTETETIGVFDVITELPNEFSGEDARLLVTMADMAGNAIHRMELNDRTRRHAYELEERVESRTQELSEALRKAQEADRLKSEFIANINHELRTPLTNLVLYYQMLRAQPAVKTQERLDVIGRELQRLRGLIENLLNLSRLDLQQVRYNPSTHDLNKIIRSLVEDRRSLAEEHNLEIIQELQSDLPDIPLDEGLIVQVISNLLTNALNYTPSGGTVWVRTTTAKKDKKPWVVFSVEDTGPGISEEEREHLFERFFRGKAGHTSGAAGTGLGLAIVREIVNRHKGQVIVPVRDKQGALFEIWLPAD